MNLSVADVIGKALTLSAEAEYSRKRTEELFAKGERSVDIFLRILAKLILFRGEIDYSHSIIQVVLLRGIPKRR